MKNIGNTVGIEAKIKHHLRRIPWLKKILKKLLRIEAVNHQFALLEQKLIYQYVAPLAARVRELEGKAGIHQPKIIDLGDKRKTSFSRVTSQAASVDQMMEPEYAEWCARINDTPNFHRKHWEYVFILKALDQHKKIKPGALGLGFGVGKDPIVAYMVKEGCKVIATDLDPAAAYEKGWAQTNQYSEKLLNLNERRICSDRAIQKQVTLRNVDMNQIPAELRQSGFDFVWSACAFEHLGSIEKGLQFVINSIECLKPGGVAVHTTELNLSSLDETLETGWTVIFRKKDIEELAIRLRQKGYEVDLNFYIGNQPMDQFYDVPPYSEFNHVKLMLDNHITTSYGIIVRKKLN